MLNIMVRLLGDIQWHMLQFYGDNQWLGDWQWLGDNQWF